MTIVNTRVIQGSHVSSAKFPKLNKAHNSVKTQNRVIALVSQMTPMVLNKYTKFYSHIWAESLTGSVTFFILA